LLRAHGRWRARRAAIARCCLGRPSAARRPLGAGRRGRPIIATASILLVAVAFAHAQQASRRAFVSKSFTHRAHLNEASDKECLVCHGREVESIGAADRTVTTLDVCATCHAREKSIEVVPAKRKEVASFARFSHTAHRAAKCATCHKWDKQTDVFSIPRDMKVCAACHGKHDTAKALFSGDCARCHLEAVIQPIPPERRGVFSHARHLPEGRPPVAADCLRCHAEAAASADVRDGKLLGARPEKCTACHFGKQGAPAIEVALERTPVRRFFTEFNHGAHAKSFECVRCHEIAKDGLAFGFAGALPKYEGCVGCHYHEPLRVRDHGHQIQCGRCHEASEPRIRTAEYAKEDVASMTVAAAAHPFLAPADLAADQQGAACAGCHLRARETIFSRIEGRPFSHAAHLGKEAAAAAARGRFPPRERCLVCHGALERSASPADSKRFEVAKDCGGCHKGGELRLATAARTERVPPFSHERHLASKNPRIGGCESCHDFAADRDRMATPADVLACTRCHDHKRNADVTGQDLDKCIRCHTGESLFRQVVEVEAPNVRLARAAAPHQLHDQGGRCTACHPPPGGFQAERVGVAEVRHRNDPHVGLTLDSCKNCHVRPKGF
jgi:hypothetical protein